MTPEDKKAYTKEYGKSYWKLNKERIMEQRRIRREANPELYKSRCREYVKKYTDKDPERVKALAKKRAEKDPERKKRRQKVYYQNNKEEVLARTRISSRAWYRANPEKARNQTLKRNYGITMEDYKNMLVEQNSNCAICGRNQSEFKVAFHVDHCHTTGAIRGLLCGSCNRALGLLKDSCEVLDNAKAYLNKHKEGTKNDQ